MPTPSVDPGPPAANPVAFEQGDHRGLMQYAILQAQQAPKRATNFRVGAVLLHDGTTGDTHAEQCAFMKLASFHGVSEEELSSVGALQEPHALYTTMEPCSVRLSGNKPCVDRILMQRSWVKRVFFGVGEPDTFVGENDGRRKLQAAGIEVSHVAGLEDEILAVATAGHHYAEKELSTREDGI